MKSRMFFLFFSTNWRNFSFNFLPKTIDFKVFGFLDLSIIPFFLNQKNRQMKKHDYTIRIAFQMFLSIAAFFILMKLFGLEHITELRFLNIVIVAFFSNRLAKLYVIDDDHIEYLHGLRSIFMANVLNVAMSVAALVFYIYFIEHDFLKNFANGIIIGGETSVAKVGVGLFMEGIAGSAIISFATMQYWKDVRRTTKNIDLNEV